MSGRVYKLQALAEISQIDVELAVKKEGNANAVYAVASDFTDYVDFFEGKYGDDGVYEHHKDFLEDVAKLRKISEKLYATTVIWDIDDLVKAFKTGRREVIQDKLDNLRISAERIVKRLEYAEADENGNLIKPPSKADLKEDEELSSQPECGKTVSGNYAPMSNLQKISEFVDKLDFEEATRLAKKVSSVYYNETFNIEVKKLIWVMRLGEFEIAEVSARKLLELAVEHNKTVDANIEVVKPRVLVVDDIPDMLLTIKGILYDLCHVCTVTNHISALRFLENCHADIIMLDVGLPEVDGFEMFKRIRELDRYTKTPIMFITGDVSKETICRAIDIGVSDYLRKPIDAEMLISRVKKHLKALNLSQQ